MPAVKFATIAVALTVNVTFAVPVPTALLALTVMFEVPLLANVPDMRPVLVFTLRPEGKPVAL